MTIGSGELTVVASHDLGTSGVRTSEPVRFAWRWYHHLSSLAFWTLALVPLVLIRENRRLPAWTILGALLAVLLFARMLGALLMLGPATAERFGTFVGTLATAWAVVWLLGPWFSRMHGWLALPIAATVMSGIGVLSCLGRFGLTSVDSWMPRAILHTIVALGLLLSMAFSGRLCRKSFSPGRFMGWLLVWMILGILVLVLTMSIFVILMNLKDGVGFLVILVPVYLIGGGFLAIFLYLFNLPFMLVAFRTPFYRQRLCQVLRLPEGASPEATRVAEDEGSRAGLAQSPPIDDGSLPCEE